MIQEEGSVFWEAITVSHCWNELSCENVSNFDSLPRESPDVTPVIFLVGLGEGRSLHKEGGYTK